MNVLKYKNQIRITFVLLLVILSFTPFYERVMDCLIYPALQNTTDMDIFAGAGKRFLNTGQLYERSGDYQSTYAPGAGVYKFPPAYQLTLLPLLKYFPDDFSFLFAQRVIQLVLYLSASALLICTIGKQFIWQDRPVLHAKHRYGACQFILMSLLFTMWSMGFFESFSGIEPEIPVFFLLALAFYFLTKNPFISGLAVAVATAIKIYPAFILLYFVFTLDKKAIAGFALGIVLITGFSIYFLGIDEHIFYIKNILPVLLQEKPAYHIQNTTIEAMFHANNIISSMSGKITTVTKASTILVVFFIGIFARAMAAEKTLLFYSAITAAILLCISNYWQQYQIILVIPIFCLLAYSIQNKSTALYSAVILTGIALCIEEGWYQDLKQKIFSEEVRSGADKIMDFGKIHPASDPILYFFPLVWIMQRMRDLVFLSPAVLFLLSAWILLKQNKLIRKD